MKITGEESAAEPQWSGNKSKGFRIQEANDPMKNAQRNRLVVSLLSRHFFGSSCTLQQEEECLMSQNNVCLGGYPVVEGGLQEGMREVGNSMIEMLHYLRHSNVTN